MNKTFRTSYKSHLITTLGKIVFTILFVLVYSTCEKNPVQLIESVKEGSSKTARIFAEPIFATSYEMETYSISRILSKGEAVKNINEAFIHIANMPRLDRQSVSFNLFADGTYEITSIDLEPEHLELLPPVMRKKKMETTLSYKTVIAKNVARYYDKAGNETGKTQLKPIRFTSLIDRIMSAGELSKGQIANEIKGHPMINEAYILAMANEKQAQINTKGTVTEIRFDLSKFAAESNESSANLSKYAVQQYDFQNRRLLGEKLYESQGDKLLYSSTNFYSSLEKGNQVEKVISETFNEEPKTGIKTKLTKQIFYKNMKSEINL